jgi:hypothetical protein
LEREKSFKGERIGERERVIRIQAVLQQYAKEEKPCP